MKIVYLFLFITYVYALSSTVEVMDLEYNKAYDINPYDYEDRYIPSGTEFYLKVNVERLLNNELELRLSVFKDEISSFKVDIRFFTYQPSDQQVIDAKGTTITGSTEEGGAYVAYSFPNTIPSNYKCVAFCLKTTKNLNHLAFYINAKQDPVLAIIDAEIGKESFLDVSEYAVKKLPSKSAVYFRYDIDSKSPIMTAKIKITRDQNFGKSFCNYNTKPTKDTINNGDYCESNLVGQKSTSGKYDEYTFSLKNRENLKYGAFHVDTVDSLDFLSFYITKEENKNEENSSTILRPFLLLLLYISLLF